MDTSLLPFSLTTAAYTLCFYIFLWKMHGTRYCIIFTAIVGLIELFLPGGNIGDPSGHVALKLDKCIEMYYDVDQENQKGFMKIFGVTESNQELLQVDSEYFQFMKAAGMYIEDLQYYHNMYEESGGIPHQVSEKFQKLAIENKGTKEFAEWSEFIYKTNARMPGVISQIRSEQNANLEKLMIRETDVLAMAHMMTWNRLALFIQFYDNSQDNHEEFNITAMEEVRDLFQQLYTLEQQYRDSETSWIHNYMPGLDMILNRGLQGLENDEYVKELKYKLIPEAKKKHENSLKQYIPWLKHNMNQVYGFNDWSNKTESKVLLAIEERTDRVTATISKMKEMISDIAMYPVFQESGLKKRLKPKVKCPLSNYNAVRSYQIVITIRFIPRYQLLD